jgi:predicted enzyme related to lactoylglutathione lyase
MEIAMANPFVHCELATHDVAKAKTFYGKLFDWKLEDMPMGDFTYTTIGVGEGTGGGMMKNPTPDAPAMWMPYVLVSDIHAATRKARELGGNVVKDVTTVGDMGWLSIFVDPTGATLGMWQAKQA